MAQPCRKHQFMLQLQREDPFATLPWDILLLCYWQGTTSGSHHGKLLILGGAKPSQGQNSAWALGSLDI